MSIQIFCLPDTLVPLKYFFTVDITHPLGGELLHLLTVMTHQKLVSTFPGFGKNVSPCHVLFLDETQPVIEET